MRGWITTPTILYYISIPPPRRWCARCVPFLASSCRASWRGWTRVGEARSFSEASPPTPGAPGSTPPRPSGTPWRPARLEGWAVEVRVRERQSMKRSQTSQHSSVSEAYAYQAYGLCQTVRFLHLIQCIGSITGVDVTGSCALCS